MAEREYKDSEGNVVTLKLVRIEPEWAANVIRWYESKLDEYEHRAKLHMDRCQHDMERIVALEQQNEALASRLGRLQDWIQERADEDCEYGEPDFEACGHNRKHGICEACSAKRVLAQDHFVSDAPVVERQGSNPDYVPQIGPGRIRQS